MAYNTQDERLLVKGNAHVKRQLKVDEDIYQEDNKEAVLPNIISDSIELQDGVVRKIDSDAVSGIVTYDAANEKFKTSNDLTVPGDLDVQGEMIARRDLSVSGDLFVNGTEHINDTETAQTSDDYLVLRHNKTTALGANEHAGVVVHNYMPNKTATLTTDNTGTWRVADNTETDTNYSAISYYNGTYYDGLGQATSVTVINGIKSAWDEDELDECVFYNNGYYHFDGTNYFAVELSGNVMVLGAMVTDPDVITALEALTGNDLVYYRSLTVTTISEVENEPILTRDEASNLSDGDVLAWDATGEKAVAAIGVAKTSDITDAINALDVADTAVAGQYVSSVSETNGVISVTRAILPASKELDWDNAVYIGNGGLYLVNSSGTTITVVDINGDSHTLSGGQQYNVAWEIPKNGKMFPLVATSTYYTATAANAILVKNSSLAKYSVALQAATCSAITTAQHTSTGSKDCFYVYDHEVSNLIHTFKANTILSSVLQNSTTTSYFVKRQTSVIDVMMGVEVVSGYKLKSAFSIPTSVQPPDTPIPFVIFVPYLNQ